MREKDINIPAEPSNPVSLLEAYFSNSQIKGYFAMLLWYATFNEVVTIEQLPGKSTTKIKQRGDSLARNAAAFGVISDPVAFRKTVKAFEKYICSQDSAQGYVAKDVFTQKPVDVSINFGVALSVVAELFDGLSHRKLFSSPAPYDPGDPSCMVKDILSIVPTSLTVPAAKASVKKATGKKTASKKTAGK